MNKIVKHAASPRNFFADHFFSVEAVTPEGAPFTFAAIYFNKHGRTNLVGVGNSKFYAGSKNRTAIKKYAATVNPDTTDKFFIISGEFLKV